MVQRLPVLTAQLRPFSGRVTAELIAEGDTVFLDKGTTVAEVARALHEKKDLTIITNSLAVAEELKSQHFIDPRRENPGIHSGDERRTNVWQPFYHMVPCSCYENAFLKTLGVPTEL